MSSATLKDQGNEHYSKQEWEKAIECYTKAIELEKDLVKTAPLLSNRAAAHLNLGDLLQGELLLSVISNSFPLMLIAGSCDSGRRCCQIGQKGQALC